MRKIVTDQSGNKYTLVTMEENEPEFERESYAVFNLSVSQYFTSKLGTDLLGGDKSTGHDKNGLDMPVATPCGFSCKLAIDAAAAFLPYCANAGESDQCIDLARNAVKVLIFG